MRLQGRYIGILLIIPLYFAVMVLVHEFGHLAGVAYSTDAEARIYVWPGYEIYPDPGRRYVAQWPGRSPAFTDVRITSTVSPAELGAQIEDLMASHSFIMLMGSTATLLVSLVCLLLLTLLKPKGVLRWLCTSGALLNLDMLSYTVFPVFFNGAHLYYWGGTTPEPVVALAGLGVAQGLAVSAILLISLLQFAWLYHALQNKERQAPT